MSIFELNREKQLAVMEEMYKYKSSWETLTWYKNAYIRARINPIERSTGQFELLLLYFQFCGFFFSVVVAFTLYRSYNWLPLASIAIAAVLGVLIFIARKLLIKLAHKIKDRRLELRKKDIAFLEECIQEDREHCFQLKSRYALPEELCRTDCLPYIIDRFKKNENLPLAITNGIHAWRSKYEFKQRMNQEFEAKREQDKQHYQIIERLDENNRLQREYNNLMMQKYYK